MCTVVIVDPCSLDIVRTVFHGSLFIGELKFMAAIPSGKYIICDSGIAIGVISILDGPLCGDGILSVSCCRGGAGLVYKVVGSDDTFKFELPCEIPVVPAVCNPLNASISIIFRQMNKFILRIEFLCPWKVGPTIEWKMLGEDIMTDLQVIVFILHEIALRTQPCEKVSSGALQRPSWNLCISNGVCEWTHQHTRLVVGDAIGHIQCYDSDPELSSSLYECLVLATKLKEKASFRNLDEFYYKMIKSKTLFVFLLLTPKQYTHEELVLMKTQNSGYVFEKIQSEKKKIEKLNSMLHSLDNQLTNKHIYYAEDRFVFPALRSSTQIFFL
ncbi:hypothetical protein IFM89_022840 [Coptis chinensis]|uniref:Uncharacterized protein n=1 Tax=Coptis chinensis TaxID=261450 RepID=A0A835IXY1_9MAGN|nr:hypothetical protein IFM89_022840 [Coptis chinensis]